jgi:hypothetical protein
MAQDEATWSVMLVTLRSELRNGAVSLEDHAMGRYPERE